MGAREGNAGNGTAMRTAALGLWFCGDHESLPYVVAEVSRITHQDSRSVAGGVAIAMAASILSVNHDVDPREFCGEIANTCRSINAEVAELLQQLPDALGSTNVLDFIAYSGQKSPEFDRPIISPFIIPTVLASLYGILTNPDVWIDAVTSAVRLGGDVDTLGAIVGALAGAKHGIDAIPKNLVSDLQDSYDIQVLAARYNAAIQSHFQSMGK